MIFSYEALRGRGGTWSCLSVHDIVLSDQIHEQDE